MPAALPAGAGPQCAGLSLIRTARPRVTINARSCAATMRPPEQGVVFEGVPYQAARSDERSEVTASSPPWSPSGLRQRMARREATGFRSFQCHTRSTRPAPFRLSSSVTRNGPGFGRAHAEGCQRPMKSVDGIAKEAGERLQGRSREKPAPELQGRDYQKKKKQKIFCFFAYNWSRGTCTKIQTDERLWLTHFGLRTSYVKKLPQASASGSSTSPSAGWRGGRRPCSKCTPKIIWSTVGRARRAHGVARTSCRFPCTRGDLDRFCLAPSPE